MSEEEVEIVEPVDIAAPTMEQAEASWRDNLPEDLRGHTGLEKYSTVESLAKGYINASSMLGKDKLVMPQSEDEWGDFYSKMGRPEESGGYEFDKLELPNDMPVDDEMVAGFKEAAHVAGLSGKQANALHAWFMGSQGEQFESMVRGAEDEITNSQAGLRKEWGNAYDQKLATAHRAVREFGGEELAAALDETGLGNNQQMIKAFAAIGEKISGDTTLEGNASAELTPSSIKEEIAKIQNDPAYYDPDNLERAGMMNRMQRLMEQLHGTQVTGGYSVGTQ